MVSSSEESSLRLVQVKMAISRLHTVLETFNRSLRWEKKRERKRETWNNKVFQSGLFAASHGVGRGRKHSLWFGTSKTSISDKDSLISFLFRSYFWIITIELRTFWQRWKICEKTWTLQVKEWCQSLIGGFLFFHLFRFGSVLFSSSMIVCENPFLEFCFSSFWIRLFSFPHQWSFLNIFPFFIWQKRPSRTYWVRRATSWCGSISKSAWLLSPVEYGKQKNALLFLAEKQEGFEHGLQFIWNELPARLRDDTLCFCRRCRSDRTWRNRRQGEKNGPTIDWFC